MKMSYLPDALPQYLISFQLKTIDQNFIGNILLMDF